MLNSSPARLLDADPNVVGTKRRAPSLLPAFEPSSSPPRFKRQKSRASPLEETENQYPVENQRISSLEVPPSSPPAQIRPRRPLLKRTDSTVSERAPLSSLTSITLPENEEPILLGRSSKSSHYGLSANRLISRVHIKATHICTNGVPRVEIQCLGWNGVKVHCQGQAWDLAKDDVFTSETKHADIMLDVQDSRVLLAWPGTPPNDVITVHGSPIARVHRSPSPSWRHGKDNTIARSAGAAQRASKRRIPSTSPSATRDAFDRKNTNLVSESMTAETFLEIYEDELHSDDEGQPELPPPIPEGPPKTRENSDDCTLPLMRDSGFESDLAIPVAIPSTPSLRRHSALPSPRRRSPTISPNKQNLLENHLTNQLAFSRVATVPLSELHRNIPASLGDAISMERLHSILAGVPCIGEVKRHGKDAAGKPLESQFYYLIDEDADEGRRAAVGGRAGVRNCRKTHKQYYWKKPKVH